MNKMKRGAPIKNEIQLLQKYEEMGQELEKIRETRWIHRTQEQLDREHYLANYTIRLRKRIKSGVWSQ